MAILRPHTLVLFTLAAVAGGQAIPAHAASPIADQGAKSEGAQDIVVSVEALPVTGRAASQGIPGAPMASPETIIAQQFSAVQQFSATAPSNRPSGSAASANPTPPSPSQYYPDYQSVTVPTETAIATTPPTALPDAPGNAPVILSVPPPVSVPPLPPKGSAPQNQAVPTASLRTPTVQAPDLVVTATDVQITGVEAELQRVVRSTIKTQPGGETNAAQLRDDLTKLLDTGLFANARVSSSANAQGLSVLFQVEPMVVRSLRLNNAQVLTPEVATTLFQPQLGAPVSPTGLTQAVRRINQWYTENGYTLARVLSLEPDQTGLVTINVAEGVVGDVQVRFVDKLGRTQDDQGNPIRHRTQPSFVQQQIKLKPGAVFRQDMAQQDLKRLSELGIFEGANVRFAGDANRATVIYNVVEAPARGVNLSGGFNEDLGLFGSVNFQDGNVGGQAQKFGSNVQIGSRDVQFDARFVSPYRDTQPDTLGYSANVVRRAGLSRVFDEDFRLANGQQVRERRLGGGITLDRPIANDWVGSVGLNYTNVSLRDRNGNIARTTADGLPLTFSGKGIDDLTTLSFTATRDLRNNFSNPSQGSILTLSTEQSIPIGRGSILGNRLQANYAEYLPVNWINPKGKVSNSSLPEVVAFNVQGGTTIGDLPPYNAYVLGGANSIRGYETGDVATSRSYVLASAEYRFPVYKFLGAALFADIGSDLGSSSSVLGEPGVVRNKPGMGFGVGAGLRINSPIGIIRADWGFNDQGENRLQFGFGQRF
jgi:outer membrane protein insertion porin family